MPSTIKGVSLNHPGNSLAVWLAAHHPDLFVAMFRQAQAAKKAKSVQLKGLGALGLDDSDLQEVTITATREAMPESFLSDNTESGSSFLSSIGNGITSAGSTVGSFLSSAGSSILGAIGTVGSSLLSPSGLNVLSGVAKSYFSAQAAQSNAVTQQAVLQAQLARAATGKLAAPITYTTSPSGALMPVYATQSAQGPIYQPLSAQGIASLTPSGVSVFLSRYGLWIALGLVGVAIGYKVMNR